MTIASMTGYARVDDATEAVRWHWEIRSVNARGLDVRTRLPAGYERFEPAVRARLQEKLSRGAVSVAMGIRRDGSAAGLRVNEAALDVILKTCETLRGRSGLSAPSPDGLLGLRGVLEVDEPDETVDAALDAAMLKTLDDALNALIAMRRGEGDRLLEIVRTQIKRIAVLVEQAETLPSRAPEEVRRRLETLLAPLLESASGLDQDRLHQEAVLLATRADIQEELDRLRAHVAAANELLGSGEAVGRRLDFLTQEFNREANTICSKSNDIALTRIGLDLKSVIDQLREQVQNVE